MTGKNEGRGNILVVDDEELICTLLARRLTKEGYQVQATTSPAEGLGLIRLHLPPGQRRFIRMKVDIFRPEDP